MKQDKKHKGISTFLVPYGIPGFTTGKPGTPAAMRLRDRYCMRLRDRYGTDVGVWWCRGQAWHPRKWHVQVREGERDEGGGGERRRRK